MAFVGSFTDLLDLAVLGEDAVQLFVGYRCVQVEHNQRALVDGLLVGGLLRHRRPHAGPSALRERPHGIQQLEQFRRRTHPHKCLVPAGDVQVANISELCERSQQLLIAQAVVNIAHIQRPRGVLHAHVGYTAAVVAHEAVAVRDHAGAVARGRGVVVKVDGAVVALRSGLALPGCGGLPLAFIELPTSISRPPLRRHHHRSVHISTRATIGCQTLLTRNIGGRNRSYLWLKKSTSSSSSRFSGRWIASCDRQESFGGAHGCSKGEEWADDDAVPPAPSPTAPPLLLPPKPRPDPTLDRP
eukprot:scaffold1581_cov342-Prasinococcus_capsulatus_cf.AAC.12